jgi:predicted tellurium resistance membrane protein TerC
VGWIILGIILLILIIILFSPVKVYVSYLDKKTEVVLKYLFVKKILVGDKKEKKPKKEKKEKKEEQQEDKKEKKDNNGNRLLRMVRNIFKK